MERETSLIRNGKETWHNCWFQGDTFYLNHYTTNFGDPKRKGAISEYVRKGNMTCVAGRAPRVRK